MSRRHLRSAALPWLLTASFVSAAAPPTCHRDRDGDPLPAGAIARLGSIRWRSNGGFGDLIPHPDGKHVIASSGDELTFWDLNTGRKTRTIREERIEDSRIPPAPFQVPAVLTPDGAKILSASMQRGKAWAVFSLPRPQLFLWDARSGRQVAVSKPMDRSPACLAIRRDGRLAAFVTDPPDVRVSLWDPHQDKLWHLHEERDLTGEASSAISFSADSKLVTAVIQRAKTVQVLRWDVATRRRVKDFSIPRAVKFALSPDGQTAAAFSPAEQLRLYDLETGQSRRLPLKKTGRLSELAFNHDGTKLLSRGESLDIWDVSKGELLRGGLRAFGSSPALSIDGRTLFTADPSMLWLWDVETGKLLNAPPGPMPGPTQLAFATDRELIALHGEEMVRWDLEDMRVAGKVKLKQVAPHVDDPYYEPGSRVFSRAGEMVLTTFAGPILALHAGKTGEALFVNTKAPRFASFAFSPDGTVLAATTQKGEVQFRDVKTGKQIQKLNPKDKPPPASWVRFSPDGKRILTGEGWEKVHVWDAVSGKRLATLRAPAARKVFQQPLENSDWITAISPGGRWLAVSSTGNLWVWDLASRQMLDAFETLDHHWRTTASGPVWFSADGRYLAWFDAGFTLCIYETASGRIAHTSDRATVACDFAPSGWRLAASDRNDCSVLVWDLGELFRSEPLPRGRSERPSTLWALLADSQAPLAQRALWRMAIQAGVEDSLAARLPVVRKLSKERLASLIGDLSSPDLVERTRAEFTLEEAREAAADALFLAARAEEDIELLLRLQRLLARLGPRSPERLRDGRAILVLEARGTPAAIALLRKLSGGLEEAHLTREARAALARLEARR